MLHAKRMKPIAICLALLIAMGGIYAYTHRKTGAGHVAGLKPAVKVETMARQDMRKRVVLSGETVPKATIDISPKYAGRIVSVPVDLGDKVSAGDLLIQQDTKDLTIAIDENRAGTREAQASAVQSVSEYDAGAMKAQSDYNNAKRSFERYQVLFEQGAVSQQERDDRHRAMIEAKAALESLQNQSIGGKPAVVASRVAAAEKAAQTVEGLEVQRSDMSIHSPIDGTIGYRNAEVGEWATVGQKLLTVVDNSHLYLDCLVAEQDIGVLEKGMNLYVSIDSLGQSTKGQIIYISPSFDEGSHSYRVRLELDPLGGMVRGGMFGRTTVEATERRDTFYVPKEAVVDDNGKKSVFLINSEGKAEKTPVTLGLSNDEDMEITSGINTGDVVAVTNVAKLRTGMEVEVEGNN